MAFWWLFCGFLTLFSHNFVKCVTFFLSFPERRKIRKLWNVHIHAHQSQIIGAFYYFAGVLSQADHDIFLSTLTNTYKRQSEAEQQRFIALLRFLYRASSCTKSLYIRNNGPLHKLLQVSWSRSTTYSNVHTHTLTHTKFTRKHVCDHPTFYTNTCTHTHTHTAVHYPSYRFRARWHQHRCGNNDVGIQDRHWRRKKGIDRRSLANRTETSSFVIIIITITVIIVIVIIVVVVVVFIATICRWSSRISFF